MLEALLDLKEEGIPAAISKLDWKLSSYGEPAFGGVYVFWWRHSRNNFINYIENNKLHYQGPNRQQLSLLINERSLKIAKNGRLPLYVGKASKSIARRIGQHLMLRTPRVVNAEDVHGIIQRRNPSCQVRDRIDRLFPHTEDMRQLVKSNLSLSYLKVVGDKSFARRFYLEDLAIGTLQPIFNVDSER